MNIRQANAQDAPAVARQYAALTAEMARLAPTVIQTTPLEQTAYFRDYIANPNAAVFLAENDAALAGFALVVAASTQADPEVVFHRFAFCIDLYVSPAQRRQGLGRALLEAVDDWRKQRDLEFVQLNVLGADRGARAFYQRLGFTAQQLTLTRP